jgi:PAS domain S-box-containing protein
MDNKTKTLSDTSLALGVSLLSRTISNVIEIGRLMFQLGSDKMTDCGYWIWNIDTDECYYSPKFIHCLGYEESDFDYNGTVFRKLMKEESLKTAMDKTQNLLKLGKSSTITNTVVYTRKDGKEVTFDCSVTTIDRNGILSILFGSHEEPKEYVK